MSVYMEGSLYKWTNYYLGWQSRWFVLNDGTLSYYLSSSQVSEGSRGSVKVSSCNITAHPKDKRRIDVIIRGEMYMYLRAASETERQKWLVVLGSAKLHEEPAAVQGSTVKSRMILLHTNCQLLVSQIAALKSAIAQKELMSDSSLDELSTGISTSCDEFLNILAECMDLNYEDSVWPAHLKPLSAKAAGSPLLGLSPRQKIMTSSDRKEGPFLSSTQSPTTFQFPGPRPLSPPNVTLPFHLQHPPKRSERQDPIPLRQDLIPQRQDPFPQRQDPIPPRQDPIPQRQGPIPQRQESRQDPIPQANSDLFLTPTSSPVNTPPPSPKPQIVTFFAKLPQKFGNIQLTATNEIPTADFLNCCRVALPFFDLLSPTAFAPVKTDINGNIEKLNRKYQSNTLRYHTLQSMVLEEFNAGSQNARNSATDALLWLKRAMQFVQVFLMEVADGEKSLDIAAGKAYSQSLRRHHNWIVIGIFNLAVKAVPYHEEFFKLLGSDSTQTSNNRVLKDMKEFAVGLKQMIVLINQFYELHGLDV